MANTPFLGGIPFLWKEFHESGTDFLFFFFFNKNYHLLLNCELIRKSVPLMGACGGRVSNHFSGGSTRLVVGRGQKGFLPSPTWWRKLLCH
jgi:hypothetical protein